MYRQQQNRLTNLATSFLRNHGYTWAGRKVGGIAPEQSAFERRLIQTPCGGMVKKRSGSRRVNAHVSGDLGEQINQGESAAYQKSVYLVLSH